MQPPRVSTAEVKAVIRELTVGLTLPAGAAVRRALQLRHGARGGVARIYRILAEERRRVTPSAPPGSVEALQQDLQAMRERAERAEAREEAHQSHWAMEVDRLRLRLQAVEPQVIRVRQGQEELDRLRRLLHVAEARVAQLEEQLMTLLAP